MSDHIDNFAMLDLIPDAVLVVDPQGCIVFANRNCTALLGWSPDELQGEPVDRLVPARFANHAALRDQFTANPSRRAMGAGLELFASRRAGGEIPVDIALNPITIAGVPHVVVAMRDMGLNRAALQELSLLSVAVGKAASGVVITDRDGVITWVNPAACQMTGYAADELIGQRPSLLKSGRHDKRFYAALWDTVRSGAIWRGSIINRRKDGSEYHEEQTIAPVHAKGGAITHFIAVKQDVTERVHAESLLRKTRDDLARQVAEVEVLHSRLREESIRDPCSSLFNRRYFDATLPRELARAQRDKTRLTLVMIDIDHFKRVNDEHGHTVGDDVIAELGGLLRSQSRASDVACRFGGEEFAVVMLNAGIDDGIARAEVWRGAFGAMSMPVGPHIIRATLSAGVAEWRADETADELLVRTDVALYAAKRAGRNRVARGA